MSSTTTDWQIRFVPGFKPERWEVYRNGARAWDGTYTDCEDFVRNRRTMRDTVVRVEPDGYRWDLTTHLR